VLTCATISVARVNPIVLQLPNWAPQMIWDLVSSNPTKRSWGKEVPRANDTLHALMWTIFTPFRAIPHRAWRKPWHRVKNCMVMPDGIQQMVVEGPIRTGTPLAFGTE
jgi:hypothetical protein